MWASSSTKTRGVSVRTVTVSVPSSCTNLPREHTSANASLARLRISVHSAIQKKAVCETKCTSDVQTTGPSPKTKHLRTRKEAQGEDQSTQDATKVASNQASLGYKIRPTSPNETRICALQHSTRTEGLYKIRQNVTRLHSYLPNVFSNAPKRQHLSTAPFWLVSRRWNVGHPYHTSAKHGAHRRKEGRQDAPYTSGLNKGHNPLELQTTLHWTPTWLLATRLFRQRQTIRTREKNGKEK